MTKFTKQLIERLLSEEQYTPVERMDKYSLTWEQKQEVNALENVTSFGIGSIDLFDSMVKELNTLPTQREYVEAGLPLMVAYLAEYRPDIVITEMAEIALTSRMTRTYMSKVVELHLDCIIKEDLPEMKVTAHPMLDSVMGVDLILEDDAKRYYVHVTSNTKRSQEMLVAKENRGGYRVGKTYIRYSRNFEGDIALRYDNHTESETTKIVNEFPLFKSDYITERFFIAKRQSKIGEDLKVPYSKLQHFKDWAKTYLNMDILSN